MCLCAGAAVGPPAGDRPFSWLCSDFVFRNGGVVTASPELSFLRPFQAAAVNVVLSEVTGIGPSLFPSHISDFFFYGDMYVVLE